jgi:hypothetical protein
MLIKTAAAILLAMSSTIVSVPNSFLEDVLINLLEAMPRNETSQKSLPIRILPIPSKQKDAF